MSSTIKNCLLQPKSNQHLSKKIGSRVYVMSMQGEYHRLNNMKRGLGPTLQTPGHRKGDFRDRCLSFNDKYPIQVINLVWLCICSSTFKSDSFCLHSVYAISVSYIQQHETWFWGPRCRHRYSGRGTSATGVCLLTRKCLEWQAALPRPCTIPKLLAKKSVLSTLCLHLFGIIGSTT